jgi:hypothetical protein
LDIGPQRIDAVEVHASRGALPDKAAVFEAHSLRPTSATPANGSSSARSVASHLFPRQSLNQPISPHLVIVTDMRRSRAADMWRKEAACATLTIAVNKAVAFSTAKARDFTASGFSPGRRAKRGTTLQK